MIHVNELTYRYPGATAAAISDLSFSVAPGTIFGFLGPSGAGKSTTQKILNGLLSGYTGRAEVLGREVAAWGSAYYEQIGVAFELPNHMQKLTARENLRYFAALYQGATLPPHELLAQVGLEADADVRVERFSKGMRMRLNVARALLHQPAVLFLDEPTSGLDPVNARRIRDLIRVQRNAGRTIFLTTHSMTIADELCDQVAILVDGRIVAIDTPRALKLRFGAPTVRVEYQNGAGLQQRDFALAELADSPAFAELVRSGAIQTIHTQEATLEHVFMQLTGRALGAEER
jgi:fluoroquinolone transport system ATP-binding protein